jgi:signal transduction histidine kinase
MISIASEELFVMTKGIKQKTHITLSIIFLCCITALVLIVIFMGVKQTECMLGRRSFTAASETCRNFNVDKIESMTTSMGGKSLEYKSIQEELSFYCEIFNIKNMFIMTRNGIGDFICLVDGSVDESKVEKKGSSKPSAADASKSNYFSYNKAMSGEVVKNVYIEDSKWGKLVCAFIPIKNSNGKVIAFLGAGIEATGMYRVIPPKTILALLFMLIIVIAGMIAVWIYTTKVTDPIVKLRDYSLKIMNGETVEPFDKTKKDEVGQLAEILENRVDTIRNILDNTGEGLLTFGSSLKINRDYSIECREIFNSKKIENQYIADLMFPDNIEERNFMEMSLEKIFNEQDSIRKKSYLSLLTSEISINGRNIHLKYKIIADITTGQEIMMVIIRDITEKKIMTSKMEDENKALDSVVKIVSNFVDFSSLVNNYFIFTSIEIWEMLALNKPTDDILYEIYGKIHTFKGDFSIYGMRNIVGTLHDFEQKLSTIKTELTNLDTERLKEYIREHNPRTWLDEDIQQLSQIFGVDLVNEIIGNGKITIIKDFRLEKFEQCIKETTDSKDRERLLTQFRKLRYKPLNSMMKLYPDYIEQLANRLNKEVERLDIKGGDFMVDESLYKNFMESLIHIFRNSLDHGIEEAEERVLKNKPEQGEIACVIDLKDKLMTITISDDGKGIDIEKLKKLAMEKNIKTADELEKMSDEEIINMIFIEEFSTKNNLTDLSGRGIGLPAFKNELNKLKGSVVVKSQSGIGTSFIITVPEVETETEVDVDSAVDAEVDVDVVAEAQAQAQADSITA